MSQAELSPKPHFALDNACLRLAPPLGVVYLTTSWVNVLYIPGHIQLNIEDRKKSGIYMKLYSNQIEPWHVLLPQAEATSLHVIWLSLPYSFYASLSSHPHSLDHVECVDHTPPFDYLY